MAQFAQAAAAGAGSSIIPFGISGWGLVPILGIPALGVAGATLWHYLAPGVLRFANEGAGSTFENSTEVTYDASVVNQERGSNLERFQFMLKRSRLRESSSSILEACRDHRFR